jgi:23S rRNA (adenine2503-C2)-methyltransferase
MKVVAKTAHSDIATVFIAESGPGKYIEFVESTQPPLPRQDKWVLIVSSLYGCPVGCRFCDAGMFYQGKVSTEEILRQIDYLIELRYPDRIVPVSKFKIQFARMGEPALNAAVLEVLAALPGRYKAPGLLPTVSTMAPHGSDGFFQKLKKIKDALYPGRFQLQFSVHSTDEKQREWLIPARKWPLDKIAATGEEFFEPGDRKITLNFAVSDGLSVDPEALLVRFSPEVFFIKLTPVNPTGMAIQNRISSNLEHLEAVPPIADCLREAGYEVLYSIGELEENKIGSNCGQHIMFYRNSSQQIEGSYTYRLQPVE